MTHVEHDAAGPQSGLSSRRDSGFVRWFDTLSSADDGLVGGKAANLGELVRAGLPVPPGFALTAAAYLRALEEGGVRDELRVMFDDADPSSTEVLAERAGQARELVASVVLPEAVATELRAAYEQLRAKGAAAVAVRSSAAGEDSATASFAGMNETFTNVLSEAELFDAVGACWRSLYGERVVNYRMARSLAGEPAIAVVVQEMVAAERAGVLFTADPTGQRPDVIMIEAAWGQGEVVVGGEVEPDTYIIDRATNASLTLRQVDVGVKAFEIVAGPDGHDHQRTLSPAKARERVLGDPLVLELARLGLGAEQHYGRPQDMEWCVAAEGRIWFVQSRPITTLSSPPNAAARPLVPVLSGLAASHGIGRGVARVLASPKDGGRLAAGEVLVAAMTKPDWLPIMRRASAIVTNGGGVTCHAAIISRELGIPCVVGTGTATTVLRDNDVITVDADHGKIYAGEVDLTDKQSMPDTGTANNGQVAGGLARGSLGTKIMVNLALSSEAARAAALPVDGVGLLRAELLVVEALAGRHPRAVLAKGQAQNFVTAMAESLVRIGQAFGDRPVIYRAIDFRTNEFRDLDGGDAFEPVEANPMIGYRGCYRYLREPDLFALELDALVQARQDAPNIHLMIPFVRTAWELEAVFALIDCSPLGRDRHLQRWIMAEVPSVVYWLDRYARLGVYGVSIGSNDLTQLILGVDRDAEALSELFDETDEAVLDAIERIVRGSRKLGMAVSLCGQAPSRNPVFAEHLVKFGIDSISVDPGSVQAVRASVDAAERRLMLQGARIATASAGPALLRE